MCLLLSIDMFFKMLFTIIPRDSDFLGIYIIVIGKFYAVAIEELSLTITWASYPRRNKNCSQSSHVNPNAFTSATPSLLIISRIVSKS